MLRRFKLFKFSYNTVLFISYGRNITMNEGTIMQRRKKIVRFSKEEILVILRAYREHPTRWPDILRDVQENLEHLPEPARNLYRDGSVKQLRDRMSVKLGKLMAAYDRIQDDEIRREVELVRAQERRLAAAPNPQPLHVQQGDADNNEDGNDEQQQNNVQHDVDPAEPPLQERQLRADRRDAIADDLSDIEDEPPVQRRRLADIVRENHELYNNFMRNTMPRILDQFGVVLDE